MFVRRFSRYLKPKIKPKPTQEKEEKQKEIKFKLFEKEIDYLDYISKEHSNRN